jgi:hypothetical protein
MKASMAEDPGNVFKAPQWVQRALQISPDAISTMTARARSAGTVQITAPHSVAGYVSLIAAHQDMGGTRSNPLL